MSGIYPDETYQDLVWMKFEGPTWKEFHELMSALEDWASQADEPFYIVYYPTIDMPNGSPLPHIKRMITFLNNESKIRHMITILPRKMVFAKHFANLAQKIFPNQTIKATMITDVEEVYEVYQDLTRVVD